jgi:hypothetical protein
VHRCSSWICVTSVKIVLEGQATHLALELQSCLSKTLQDTGKLNLAQAKHLPAVQILGPDQERQRDQRLYKRCRSRARATPQRAEAHQRHGRPRSQLGTPHSSSSGCLSNTAALHW